MPFYIYIPSALEKTWLVYVFSSSVKLYGQVENVTHQEFSHEKISQNNRETLLLNLWTFLSFPYWEAREEQGLWCQGIPATCRPGGQMTQVVGDLLTVTGGEERGKGLRGGKGAQDKLGPACGGLNGIWGKLSVVCAGRDLRDPLSGNTKSKVLHYLQKFLLIHICFLSECEGTCKDMKCIWSQVRSQSWGNSCPQFSLWRWKLWHESMEGFGRRRPVPVSEDTADWNPIFYSSVLPAF